MFRIQASTVALGCLALAVPCTRAQPHFTPVPPTGIPYAIVITTATINDDPLLPGDEIGIFDGNLCVGAAEIAEEWPVAVTAWQSAPGFGLEGFLPGHTILFRLFQESSGLDVEAIATFEQGDGTFGHGFATLVSSLQASVNAVPGRNGSIGQPERFHLLPASPNPFNSSTRIQVDLHTPTRLDLELFNATGRSVATLAGRHFGVGRHEFHVDFTGLASGSYIVVVRAGEEQQQQRLVLLR